MKRLFLVLLCALMIFACDNGINIGGLTPPEQSICAKSGYEESWICEVTAKMSMVPEDLHGILLDTYAIGVIADEGNASVILEFTKSARDFLSSTTTWNQLIALAFEDAKKSALIAGIVQRRLGLFASDSMINELDRGLIEYHLDEVDVLLAPFVQ